MSPNPAGSWYQWVPVDPEIQVTKKIKAKTHLSSIWTTFICSLREITHFYHEESTRESIFSKHGIQYGTKPIRNMGTTATWMWSGSSLQALWTIGIESCYLPQAVPQQNGVTDAGQTFFLVVSGFVSYLCLLCGQLSLCYFSQCLPFSKGRNCSGILWGCRIGQVTERWQGTEPCCQLFCFWQASASALNVSHAWAPWKLPPLQLLG